MGEARVAFLFLGETLLIPHLWPIVPALAEAAPDVAIDLWVSTSFHEERLSAWAGPAMRVRRAPGFRRVGADDASPRLPAKLPMLARLAPRLSRAQVAVCAEQTSLWLPRLLPMRTRFVKTSHGVGSMSNRDDPRRRAARVMLVPSERERATYLARGFDPARVAATGYVKASFAERSHARPPFAQAGPTLLYAPHWQRHRSSWWEWGAAIVERLAAQTRWNVILAPHQRLVEGAPEVREVLAKVAALPHVHCDLTSFAMIDGSYTAAADLYLGDTSSQVIEFAARPRPCVFLNPRGTAWPGDPSYAMWAMGEVVERLDDVLAASDRAGAAHDRYAPVQAAYVAEALGDVSGAAPARAAREILAVLAASR